MTSFNLPKPLIFATQKRSPAKLMFEITIKIDNSITVEHIGIWVFDTSKLPNPKSIVKTQPHFLINASNVNITYTISQNIYTFHINKNVTPTLPESMIFYCQYQINNDNYNNKNNTKNKNKKVRSP